MIMVGAKFLYLLSSFFVCKRTGFAHQRLIDFAKMTLTLISSHWLRLESSHSVKNVTRVASPLFSSWLELSPSHQKSWLESRYHCCFLTPVFS